MRIIILLTTLGLIFLAGCTQKPADEIMLRYSFIEGREQLYNHVVKMNYVVTENGKTSQPTLNNDTIQVMIKCNQIKDDTTAEFYELITSQNLVPNKEDSTKIDTVNSELEMTFDMSRSGKLSNIQFDSTVHEHYVETFRRTMEQTGITFPNHPITPGYEWKKVTKVYHEGKEWEAEMNSTFKAIVRESGYDCALIEVKGNSVVPVDVVRPDGTKVTSFDKITLTGFRYLAFKEGIIIKQYEHKITERDLLEISNNDTTVYHVNIDRQSTILLKKNTTP